MKQIILYINIIISIGELERFHLELSPLWCNYYHDDEIKELEKIGIERQLLMKYLVEPIENGQMHPHYSVLGDYKYKNSEFLSVRSKVTLFDREFIGYSYLINREINSVSIFTNDNEVLVFNEADILDEENYKDLLRLIEDTGWDLNINSINTMHINIEISKDVKYLKYYNKVLEVPLCIPGDYD